MGFLCPTGSPEAGNGVDLLHPHWGQHFSHIFTELGGMLKISGLYPESSSKSCHPNKDIKDWQIGNGKKKAPQKTLTRTDGEGLLTKAWENGNKQK